MPLLLSSCAARSPWADPRPPAEELIEASVDEVWRALPDVYRYLGLPISEMNTQSRSITSAERIELSSLPFSSSAVVGSQGDPMARCSGSPRVGASRGDLKVGFGAPYGLVEMRVQTVLRVADEGTMVRSQLTASRASSGSPPEPRRASCVSTGLLEAEVIAGVRSFVEPPENPAF